MIICIHMSKMAKGLWASIMMQKVSFSFCERGISIISISRGVIL